MKKLTFIKTIQTFILALLFFTIVPCKPISADSYIAYSLDSSGKKVADYTNISDAIKATRENGYKIVMSKDWEVSSQIDIVEGTSATIEMNGHKIKRIGIGEVFILHPSSTLNLLGNMASNTTFNFKDNTNGITKGELVSGGLITNGNVSGNNNGAIYMKKKATLNLTNVAVAGNLGSINGAAIYVDGASCIINMNNAKVNYNKTSSGAGVYSDNDNTSIYLENNSEFCYNTVTYHGAAVFFNDTYSSLISKDSTGKINHNSSSNGTVYLAEKYDEIKNVTFDSNSSGNGGAIFISSGNNHIDGCTIINNIATHDGGGIFMAGDATVKDTIITNNTCNTKYYDSSNTNYDGGGVSVGDYIDITLVGTVIIKDNKRINGSSKGYTEDDVYLGTDKAYIRAQSLSSDSIVGVRTANTNDVRIVKNLYSFNYGHVFFLDLADRFHFSYESEDNELWQRSGKTQYSVYVNGMEIGRYDYNQKVVVNFYNYVTDNNFTNWYSYEGLELTDEEKKSSTLTFNMPARDVVLKADLTSKEATSLTVTVDAPILGKALNKNVTVNLMTNGIAYKAFGSNVVWQIKNNDGTYTDLPSAYIAKAGETYRIRGGLAKEDGTLISYSKSIKNSDVKVIYKVDSLEMADYSSYAQTDNYNNLDFFGQDSQVVNQILSVKDYIRDLYIPVGISFDELYSKLPTKVETYDVSTGKNSSFDLIISKEVVASKLKDKALFDDNNNVNNIGSRTVTLSLTIDNPNDYNLLVKEIYVQIHVAETIKTIPDTNINVYVGDNSYEISSRLPNYVNATTYSGRIVKLKVDIPDTLYWDKLEPDGVVEGCDDSFYCVVDKPNTSYEFELDASVVDDGNTSITGDYRVKIIINIKSKEEEIEFSPGLSIDSGIDICPGFYSLATTNDIMLAEENNDTPEYDENGNLIIKITNYTQEIKDKGIVITYSIDGSEGATYDVGNAITLSSDQYATVAHKLALTISKDNITNYYEYTYIIDPSGSYTKLAAPTVDKDSDTYNTANLDINLTCQNNDATIYYLKYYDNADGSLTKQEGTGSSITLTAKDNEYKAYALEIWSELNGATSSHKYYFYELNNKFDSYNVTINTKSTDGSLNETKKLIVQKGDYISLPEVIGYSVWGDATVTPSGSAEAVHDTENNTWDRYTYQINETSSSNIELDVTYMPVISFLDIEMDDLTPGNVLPKIKSITGTLLGSETTINLINFFNVNDINWSVDSSKIDSTSLVDYDTTYKALLQSKSEDYLYVFSNDGSNITDNNKGYVLAGSGTDNYLAIYFNKSKSYVSDKELDFALSSIGSLSYDDLKYDTALSFKNLDDYELPKVIEVRYSDTTNDLLDITWDSNFTVAFDSNNTNAQQLVIKGHINLPSYISNPNNLDTNITLTINVDAKKIDQVSIVNKEDAISKLELTDEEKQQISKGAAIDIKLDVSEDTDEKDIALLNDNLNNYTLGQALDLTLTKIITYDNIPTEQEVYQTTSPIEVSITITDALINKTQGIEREYKVLRVHDDKVDVLDASFNSSNKTITFKSDKFSTYAIVYKDTYKNNGDSNPKEGSNPSCQEYMNSKNWTWSEVKKACVYRVSNTSSK